MIFLVTSFSWINISNPLINLRSFLSQKRITFLEFHLRKPQQNGNKILLVMQNTYRLIRKRHDAKYVFCFDSVSLLICSLIFKRSRQIIYFQLEFSETNSFFKKKVFKIERFLVKRIKLFVSFDEIRTQYLRTIYSKSVNFFNVANTPNRNLAVPKKAKVNKTSEMIRFGLSGSLIEEHCTYEIVQAFSQFKEKASLKINGWFTDENYKKKVLSLISSSANIYYEGKATNKKDIYSNIDFGIISYSELTINTFLAGKSSGRLFEYMLNGVPVIVRNTPGMDNIIEDLKFGQLFNEYSEIFEIAKRNLGKLSFDLNVYNRDYNFSTKMSDLFLYLN